MYLFLLNVFLMIRLCYTNEYDEDAADVEQSRGSPLVEAGRPILRILPGENAEENWQTSYTSCSNLVTDSFPAAPQDMSWVGDLRNSIKALVKKHGLRQARPFIQELVEASNPRIEQPPSILHDLVVHIHRLVRVLGYSSARTFIRHAVEQTEKLTGYKLFVRGFTVLYYKRDLPESSTPQKIALRSKDTEDEDGLSLELPPYVAVEVPTTSQTPGPIYSAQRQKQKSLEPDWAKSFASYVRAKVDNYDQDDVLRHMKRGRFEKDYGIDLKLSEIIDSLNDRQRSRRSLKNGQALIHHNNKMDKSRTKRTDLDNLGHELILYELYSINKQRKDGVKNKPVKKRRKKKHTSNILPLKASRKEWVLEKEKRNEKKLDKPKETNNILKDGSLKLRGDIPLSFPPNPYLLHRDPLMYTTHNKRRHGPKETSEEPPPKKSRDTRRQEYEWDQEPEPRTTTVKSRFRPKTAKIMHNPLIITTTPMPPPDWARDIKVYARWLYKTLKRDDALFHRHMSRVIEDFETKYGVRITEFNLWPTFKVTKNDEFSINNIMRKRFQPVERK